MNLLLSLLHTLLKYYSVHVTLSFRSSGSLNIKTEMPKAVFMLKRKAKVICKRVELAFSKLKAKLTILCKGPDVDSVEECLFKEGKRGKRLM